MLLKRLGYLIAKDFGQEPDKLSPIGSGEISTAYSFEVKNKTYVLRLAAKDSGFKNDQFVSKFSSNQLFIPATLSVGRFERYFYSITQKCPGRLIDRLDYNHRLELLPNFIATTHYFHSLSMNSTSGFGPLNQSGDGLFDNWLDYLLSLSQNPSSLWPQDYFSLQLKKMNNFFKFIPSIHQLIHGDYGFNNVFAYRGSISGVIDWSDAKYGDFVYDIAYLSFWSKAIDYSKVFFNFYRAQKQLNLNNYSCRFYCYTIHIALSLLNYYSTVDQPVLFNSTKNKLDDFLALHSL